MCSIDGELILFANSLLSDLKADDSESTNFSLLYVISSGPYPGTRTNDIPSRWGPLLFCRILLNWV
jgi:hypothetical protein